MISKSKIQEDSKVLRNKNEQVRGNRISLPNPPRGRNPRSGLLINKKRVRNRIKASLIQEI